MDVHDQAALMQCLMGTARGEREAFAELYRRTSGKLFAVTRRILQRVDLAEEALQESYMRIWNNAARYDAVMATPMTWMIAIARHQAIDIRRRVGERMTAQAASLDDVEITDIADTEAMEQAPELARLKTCLEGLGEQPRTMVLLAYHQGFSREELSARFDRPVATIKTILRRSLGALKECLDGAQ